MIAVVDYKAGNLTSVKTALSEIGANYLVTDSPEEILQADQVIFPGVGEARQSMEQLQSQALDQALKSFAASGKPLLGICLGCQIMQDFSEERETELLGLIPGRVRLFPADMALKVPQIGWNTIKHDDSLLFKGIPADSSFYFVHSYYIDCNLKENQLSPWVCARADYGIPYAAAIHRDNVWGTQFHPEKSGVKGLTLLKNFVELIK